MKKVFLFFLYRFVLVLVNGCGVVDEFSTCQAARL